METKVLDHGYVKLIESWGSDERVIEAARMSTGKGFLGWGPTKCETCYGNGNFGYESNGPAGWVSGTTCERCKGKGIIPGDEKLLKYLYDHRHHTPFEMAGMIIEVQAPIFVFREWQRHRTQSYNELSARYTQLPEMFYVPSSERLDLPRAATKQAQGAEWNPQHSIFVRNEIIVACSNAYLTYKKLLSVGVAREVARTVLPVGMYSSMRASANLRNWLAFMTLRCDENAQWEIRQYANIVASMIGETFPRTHQLWSVKRGQ